MVALQYNVQTCGYIFSLIDLISRGFDIVWLSRKLQVNMNILYNIANTSHGGWSLIVDGFHIYS